MRKTTHFHGGRTSFQPARVDKNQPEIVRTFRQLGCTVEHLHAKGQGCPDLLVGVAGLNLVVEVKDGKKPPSARKLTRFQEWWFLTWQGQRCVIKSTDEAAALVKAARDYAARIKACGIALDGLNQGE